MIGPTQTSVGEPVAAWVLRGEELRESFAVPPEPVKGVELLAAELEAVQALEHVVRPARLAELAVAQDVDARCHLVPDDLGDGGAQGCAYSA